ncbi:hypothetical protein ACFPRL_14025 [Pseudoclavibacter helvolus]
MRTADARLWSQFDANVPTCASEPCRYWPSPTTATSSPSVICPREARAAAEKASSARNAPDAMPLTAR